MKTDGKLDAELKTNLVDYFPVAGLVVDSITGKIIIANKKWLETFSWKLSEIGDVAIHDIQHAYNVGNLFSLLKTMIDSDLRKVEFYHDQKTADGKNFFVLEANPLRGNHYLLITLTDQTDERQLKDSIRDLNRELRRYTFDLKQSDRLIREAEDRFNRLFDNSAEGVAVIDVNDQNLLMSNKALARILGIKSKDGKHHQQIENFGKKKARIISMLFNKVNKRQFTFRNDTILLTRKSGKKFFIGVNSSMVILDRKRYLMLIIRDVTEQVEEEKKLKESRDLAERSLKFKTDFLANMSHEIRTPLNGIMGMVNFLLETELDKDQEEYAENIKKSADGLLLIINDILDLSKIEAGKMEIKPRPFNMRETISRIEALFKALSKRKELNFITKVENGLPTYFKADERRLQQVLTNLIGNAIKFTASGSITWKTSLVNETEKGAVIKMEVIDTGKGIRKEDQEKLFQKFTQLNTSAQFKTAGTGLGLTISLNLVELMGGEIGVESEPGKGSNFWFTFPVEKVSLPQATGSAGKSSKPVKTNLSLKASVLVVEDVPLNQMVARLMLENFGCEVEIANNGQEALDQFKVGKFDYIFMDIQMPVMDGIEATKQLKKKYPDELPPIIGLSANAMEGDAERYIAMGLDDYISKPVKKEIMAEKLISWRVTE